MILGVFLGAISLFGSFKSDAAQAVADLIKTTEDRLAQEKELFQLLNEIVDDENRFFAGEQTKPVASAMISKAQKILEIIHTLKLEYLFESIYLEELDWISSLGRKKTPARP